MAPEVPDPQSFIDMYGPEARVVFADANNKEMTLGQALQFEAMFCTADDQARQDPAKRIGYLAQKLAAGGSLKPEHEYLLGETE